MKSLLGILCLSRPRSFEACISRIIKSDERNDLIIVVVDNGSDERTQEVIQKYRKDIDMTVRYNWNAGYCFGVNTWMSMRDPGQHCIQIDQDLEMHSQDWWTITKSVLQDKDIGMLAARRPSAWIDRPDKREGYKNLYFTERHGHWLEVPRNNCLIAPMLVYKGELLDIMGFENEATGYGDLESYFRVAACGYLSAYIPDIFLYQWPNETEPQHPQRGSHSALLQLRQREHIQTIQRYMTGGSVYCGTRFLPFTMEDQEYALLSEENWKFLQNWEEK